MKSMCAKTLTMMACIMISCTGWSQVTVEEPARFEVAVTYDSLFANVTTGNEFTMQGGGAQVHGRVWRGLGIVADLAGLHTGNVSKSAVGLNLITATFGPRYTWTATHRVDLFGQVLTGEAHGMNGAFPSSTILNSSGNSLALQLGGGVNLRLTPRISARVLDANWLHTQLANATTNVQNNCRLGAGIVYRFR